MEGLEIKEYTNKYHKQFKDINLHWLTVHELYEKADDALLDNPGKFIKNGATILLAHLDGNIVGTICILPVNKETSEIFKFAVLERYQGKGIGNKLMQKAIDVCHQNNVTTIVLESSSKLQNALKLYEKFGFEHVEIKNTHFVTADIKMELKLK